MENHNEQGFIGIFEPRCKIRFLSDPHPKEEYIALPVSEYVELLTATLKLDALESWGVDNWHGYGDALGEGREELRTCCYNQEQLSDYARIMKSTDQTVEDYLEDMNFQDFAEFEAYIL